jgi:hypothetical protein
MAREIGQVLYYCLRSERCSIRQATVSKSSAQVGKSVEEVPSALA